MLLRSLVLCCFSVFLAESSFAVERNQNPWAEEFVAQISQQISLQRSNRAEALPTAMVGLAQMLQGFESMDELREVMFPGFKKDLGSSGMHELKILLMSGVSYREQTSLPFTDVFLPGRHNHSHSRNLAFGYAPSLWVPLYLTAAPTEDEVVRLFWDIQFYSPYDFTGMLSRQILASLQLIETEEPTRLALQIYLDQKLPMGESFHSII